jgi:hypothetical protein
MKFRMLLDFVRYRNGRKSQILRSALVSSLLCCFRLTVYVLLTCSWVVGAHAWTVLPTTLGDLTASAARIFWGQCLAARAETLQVADARIPVTTYTFRVSEYLKGVGPNTITFRQVGTQEGGPRDLGRLAGLPVYVPGTEYVLFLLPESSAGLTSPAGAGQGAFVVSGGQVRGVHRGLGVPGPSAPIDPGSQAVPPGTETMSYEEFRRAVLGYVSR